ncbi:MAG: RagB/SusD family nutrient uptake outer membrane protein [Prevotellaceae bacterium]|nr:RagB/SusD family nutrient uptake outer membrane protein [Candidatus Minthosoma caballi]
MKIKNIIQTLAICASAGFLSSCDDFLTIKPLNEIVLENYWTEEKDVNSVLNSCYAQLESADCIQRMVVWGELRSDNIEAGSGTSNDIQQILKENLLETNGFTTWDSFYKVINLCNTVIHYAPGVQQIDPNYTPSELRATVAEATAIRSLCYFYLIRTYRDVPYVTEPSLEDDQEYKLPASKFDAVLDSIIRDVEAVSDDAVRTFGLHAHENTTRITRWACYAMLADMYLWKGDYQKCIDYCDLIIDQKIKEYEYELEENPTTLTLELYGKYPLISEAPSKGNTGGNTYNEIFGTGNSFESIFELNFDTEQKVLNSTISSFYGSSSNQNGQMATPSYFTEGLDNNTNEYFRKTDCRFLENIRMESSKNYIQKYVAGSVSYRTSTTTNAIPSVDADLRSNASANWIIYRLTDIMLMRAEAEVELAGDVKPDMEITEDQEQHYRKAFESVIAVWRRGNNMREATRDTLVYDDYASSRMSMEDLVYGERQRELMFEGKRWYDLVRMCRRDGDNSRMISKVVSKFKQDQASIRIRLAAQDALYFPYNRNELKVNKFLVQNPAYKSSDNYEQNK